MKKKIFLSLLVIISLFVITGCDEKNNNQSNSNSTGNKQMQQAADMEELQLAVISAMDYTTGEIVRADLVASLSSTIVLRCALCNLKIISKECKKLTKLDEKES